MGTRKVALSLAVALTACQGTGTVTNSRPNQIGGYIEQFPQKIGTSWLYSVEDPQQNQLDTVRVLIEELVEASDTSRTWRWRFESRHGNIVWPDYNVTISGSRVTLTPLEDDPFDRYVMLVFPLCPDSFWNYGQMVSVVQDLDTLNMALGQFVTPPILSIWSPVCLSCNYWYEHWYVPEIGFVRMVHGGGIHNELTYQVWNLLEWHPGRFPIKHIT